MPQLRAPNVLDRLAARQENRQMLADGHSARRRMLLERAAFLRPRDLQLAKLAWEYGLPMRAIAELRGVCNGVVSRQLSNLERRLTTPLAGALTDPGCTLDDFDRELAIAHHLQRRSVAEVAGEHGVPYQEVRRRLQFVQGWFNGRKDGVRLARGLSRAQGV